MKKSTLLKILNYLLYLTSCALISAGMVLKYRLSGPRLRGATLLGFPRHEWEDWHFILGVSFFILAALHLSLNWSWVKKVASSNNAGVLLASVGLGILLIGLPWFVDVVRP